MSDGKNETSMTEVLTLLKKQQTQIDELVKLVGKPGTSSAPHVPSEPSKPRDRGLNKDGQRVCFRCRKTDHMIRDCPYPPPPGRTDNRAPADVTGVSVATSSQGN